MAYAPKREKREKKLLVKEEIGGESIAKLVFQIKTPEKKIIIIIQNKTKTKTKKTKTKTKNKKQKTKTQEMLYI